MVVVGIVTVEVGTCVEVTISIIEDGNSVEVATPDEGGISVEVEACVEVGTSVEIRPCTKVGITTDGVTAFSVGPEVVLVVTKVAEMNWLVVFCSIA